ncbi:MAG: bifunctional demethylmenaquinone methyltransferase/2-methoxy-6-polyprenyl-1,4-benzoquinol methylase UbiE [Thermoprotei archaeon]|nr:bifunctional demethylmenaquinone methyltransferase/2-methoxy-6-polyprenyl-1,4-benzoquinol methylase UbiE [Thermoprotei archaeon]
MRNPEGKALTVKNMFDRIAGRYDLMNSIASLRMDKLWRRRAARECSVLPGASCLDVCTGTGMLALELADSIRPGGRVVGVDFSRNMLAIARERVKNLGFENTVELVEGDALSLPFNDDTFDCVTLAFCLRHFESIEEAVKEMVRVAKPGGRIVILEFSRPSTPLYNMIYRFYLDRIVPMLGKAITGDVEAYWYLADSIKDFPVREELKAVMEKTGLKNVEYYELSMGSIAIHRGIKRLEL